MRRLSSEDVLEIDTGRPRPSDVCLSVVFILWGWRRAVVYRFYRSSCEQSNMSGVLHCSLCSSRKVFYFKGHFAGFTL